MSGSEGILVAVAVATSALAATLGLGGGLVLIAVMPWFLPMEAVVPVHGCVQLASNVSRALFGLRDMVWRVMSAFLAGCALGVAGGAQVIGRVPVAWMPVILGFFILAMLWLPRRWLPRRVPGGYLAAGALQTVLSLFVGATGPVNAAILAREELPRDQTVVTHAGMMTAIHTAKIITFGLVGFVFAQYWVLITAMVGAAVLGSWAGTRLRARVSEGGFRLVFKGLLTLLALRLLLRVLL